ncbi:MAG: GNAT family N-acetyltransferase [marine benthic group bacterium]|nr:GNAT family N-acetyltransferase [Gemmatimonadota bacterium]MCL7937650.1 GNAT family N-acetyltransferase [Gemmatimonadota bacterium]MCL7968280.1 GNAT family N-acetyltransferase [Gemmatimonadota bacterium]
MSPDEIGIRPFAPAFDNEALVRLAASLAIPARVRLGIDRSPSFNGAPGVPGEPHEILVAELRGEVVGFIEFAISEFCLFEKPIRVGHVPLAGVRPEMRRRGVLTALRDAAFSEARCRKADLGLMLVNANNVPMQSLLRAAFPELVSLAPLFVHGILARIRPAFAGPRRRFEIERAPGAGSPTTAAFVKERMGAFDLRPDLEIRTFDALPGREPDDFVTARDRNGDIAAVISTWDVSAWKRPVILGYGSIEGAIAQMLNALLALRGRPPFPTPGGALNVRYALCPLARPGSEEALQLLLDDRLADASDAHAILVAVPRGDPRARAIRSFARFVNVNIPFLIPLHTDAAKALRSRPPMSLYLEYAFH